MQVITSTVPKIPIQVADLVYHSDGKEAQHHRIRYDTLPTRVVQKEQDCNNASAYVGVMFAANLGTVDQSMETWLGDCRNRNQRLCHISFGQVPGMVVAKRCRHHS